MVTLPLQPRASWLDAAVILVARLVGSWRYVTTEGRDLRLDFLRGCLVVAMLVDHLGGASWLFALTGGNHFYVSAAEGFVYLSGLVMGLVYARVIARHGLWVATRRAWRRAATIYGWAVGLTLTFSVASTLTGAGWAEPLNDLPRFTLDVVRLQRSAYLADVLMLYAVLILVSPLSLALLARQRTLALLAGSAMIWGLYQAGVTRPIDALFGALEWFPPLAWQFIFVAGLATGFHWRRLHAWASDRRWGWPVAGLALAGAGLIALSIWAPVGPLAEPIAEIFGKEGLRPGRLLTALVFFPLLLNLTTILWRPLHGALGWLLLPLGQRALVAYAMHLFLVLVANVWWLWLPGYELDDPGRNSPAQLLAVLALWAAIRGMAGGQALIGRLTASRASLTRSGTHPAAGDRRGVGVTTGFQVMAGLTAVFLVVILPIRLALTAGTVTGPSAQPVASIDQASAPVTVGIPATPFHETPRPAPVVPTYIARRLATQAALAASAAPQPTPTPLTNDGSEVLERSFFSPTLDREMSYLIYLPPGYSQATEHYPVLYLLHGLGGDRGEWAAVGVFTRARALAAAGRITPMLIVLPEGEQSYWINHVDGPAWSDYIAFDLIDHIDITYRTRAITTQRAIGGLSMGAHGALSLALAHPDRFSIAGLHSPSFRSADQALPFFGTGDDFAQRDPLSLIRAGLIPPGQQLWIDAGTDDGWVGSAEELHAALVDLEVPHEWHLFPGIHDDPYWAAHVDDYLVFYSDALTVMRDPHATPAKAGDVDDGGSSSDDLIGPD